MTDKEYNEELLKIEQTFKEGKKALASLYAAKNKKYSVGDIIKDHSSIIKVERIMWGFSITSKFPQTCYRGTRLKKDLTPRKDDSIDTIWESDDVVKLN